MDKIIKVNFEEGWKTQFNNSLTQEDFGLHLQIEGITLPDGNVEVHFSLTEHIGEALVSIGTVKDNVITVEIPDFILAKENVNNSSYKAYAWIYVTDGESGRTIRKIVFTINTRPKFTANVPEDQKDKFLQEVRQIMAETKEVAQSVRDDADNGKFSGIPGEKGEDGKSAYDYAVEGGFKGTEQEFIDLMAQAGHVDLTGFITKEEHEAELLKAFVKVTTEPSPYHHITDSANMKVVDFGMSGKIEQRTTSGKNRIDPNTEQRVSNSVYYHRDEPLLCKAGQAYVYKIYNVPSNITITGIYVYVDGTDKKASFQTDTLTFTFDEDAYAYIRVVFSGSGTDLSFLDDCWCQLETGSVATEYEPHTGNQPSPNPDYKQPITLAGVLNEETGRYEHKCCVGNRNFWDKEYAKDKSNWDSKLNNAYYCLPVYVGTGHKVTISYPLLAAGITGLYACVTLKKNYDDVSRNWIYHPSGGVLINNELTLTSIDGYVYLWVLVDGIKNGSFMQYIGNDLQIEISSSATELLPHASQQFTLTSDRPLTKWDNLVKVDGKWYWDYKQLKLVVDGTHNWVVYAGRGGFYSRDKFLPFKTSYRDGLCNQFRNCKSNTTLSNGMQIGLGNNDRVYFINTSFYDDTLEDKGLANWKAHLNEHPLEIYTYKDESELVPLLDEEQTILNNLETYYGVTNVYNEQGCPMWLTYVADTKLYVDQKLLQIQQAII